MARRPPVENHCPKGRCWAKTAMTRSYPQRKPRKNRVEPHLMILIPVFYSHQFPAFPSEELNRVIPAVDEVFLEDYFHCSASWQNLVSEIFWKCTRIPMVILWQSHYSRLNLSVMERNLSTLP